MNYQQAIADATKQIRCRSAAAAAVTTAEITGSGFFSCFPAVVDAAATTVLAYSTTEAAVAARTTTAAVTGSGFFSCFPAVVVTADIATTTADAANVLIPEGPSIRALSHCNNGY